MVWRGDAIGLSMRASLKNACGSQRHCVTSAELLASSFTEKPTFKLMSFCAISICGIGYTFTARVLVSVKHFFLSVPVTVYRIVVSFAAWNCGAVEFGLSRYKAGDHEYWSAPDTCKIAFSPVQSVSLLTVIVCGLTTSIAQHCTMYWWMALPAALHNWCSLACCWLPSYM